MAEGCGTLWRRDSSRWVIVVYEVHILTRQSLTRKERLKRKSGLLGMIIMLWRIPDNSFGTFVDSFSSFI